MDAAREAVDERFEGFARNTLEYMREERDLLFGGAGLPALSHTVAGRHVLVVVRGYGYREDLAALRSYIRDVKPLLMGVDGGADALLDAGYTPDVVIGDMDSISDRALALISRRRGGRTDVVLHAYPDGRAPGRARLERLGIPHVEVRSAGTSEDIAFLLAHERRAELIVAVGTHGNLREFLDKGRPGMSSTFLVRLRVGEILMDAKGVARLYPSRARTRDVLLLAGAVLVTFGLMLAASPSLRLYLDQTVVDWIEVAAVISWRYHVVSIVAVVLAFGLGILAGSSVVGDELVKQLRRNTEEARRERDEALAMVEQHAAFAEGLQPTLRDGVLTGEEAIVVTMGGVDEPARATVEELTAAGVEVLATLELDPRLTDAETPENVAAMEEVLGLVGSDPDSLTGRMADALAVRLAAGPEEGEEDLLGALMAAGLVTADRDLGRGRAAGDRGRGPDDGGRRRGATPRDLGDPETFLVPFTERLVQLGAPRRAWVRPTIRHAVRALAPRGAGDPRLRHGHGRRHRSRGDRRDRADDGDRPVPGGSGPRVPAGGRLRARGRRDDGRPRRGSARVLSSLMGRGSSRWSPPTTRPRASGRRSRRSWGSRTRWWSWTTARRTGRARWRWSPARRSCGRRAGAGRSRGRGGARPASPAGIWLFADADLEGTASRLSPLVDAVRSGRADVARSRCSRRSPAAGSGS